MSDRDPEREALRSRREALKDERDALKEAHKREQEALKRDRDRLREALKAEAEAVKEADKRERERHREALKDERERQRDAAKAERERQREAQQAEREALKDAHDRDLRLPADIAVLWRTDAGPRRGPRPGLTLDDIADAAIAIADAEGLDAVSMARVAADLGYTAMSLYRYVASKDEVVALMIDRATGNPPPTSPAAGWRARLETLVRAQLPVLARHPWITTTPLLYHALGPHRLAWMDAFVAALDGTGLTPTQKMAITGSLANQALADARASAVMAAAASRSAAAGEAAGLNALLAAVVDPEAYPALAATTATGDAERPAGTPVDALTPGLRLLLDGIAAWIEAAAASAG